MTMTILLNLDREFFLQIYLAINAKFKRFKSIAPGIPSSKERERESEKKKNKTKQNKNKKTKIETSLCFPLRQGTNFVVTFALLSYGSCMWKNYNSDLPPRVVHKVTLDRVFVPFHGSYKST